MNLIKTKINKRGFTLIELLLVVAIIAVLSSIIFTIFNSARAKSRDARRLADVKELQTVLELYYDNNGHYPPRDSAVAGAEACGGNTTWCALLTDLELYMPDIGDPAGRQVQYRYYYDSDSGDNYQTYGLMIRLESVANFSKATNDGGYYDDSYGSYYEVGEQPIYCQGKYSGPGGNWWLPEGGVQVCTDGN